LSDNTSGQNGDALRLALLGFRFALEHPFAASGLLGAVAGSVVTYQVMTHKPTRDKVNGIFTPKVYEIALSREDLQRMLMDPDVEVRMDAPELSVVVTAEKREPLKQLPDIIQEH
jgi:hypothetical protein